MSFADTSGWSCFAGESSSLSHSAHIPVRRCCQISGLEAQITADWHPEIVLWFHFSVRLHVPCVVSSHWLLEWTPSPGTYLCQPLLFLVSLVWISTMLQFRLSKMSSVCISYLGNVQWQSLLCKPWVSQYPDSCLCSRVIYWAPHPEIIPVARNLIFWSICSSC